MSKVWEFFENMNEAVYASDVDTYELIYLNKASRNLFHFKDKKMLRSPAAMLLSLRNVYQ